MVTLFNESLIVKVIKNNGQYKDDPVVQRITAYISPLDGSFCFGIEYEDSIYNRYAPSPTVKDPIVIFDLTHDNEVAWLKDANDFFKSNPGDEIRLAVQAANDVGYAPLGQMLANLKHRVHCLVLRGERWVGITAKEVI